MSMVPESLRQEAEELYPIIVIDGMRQGDAIRATHVRAKTISAEQVEEAAKSAYYATGTPISWDIASKPQRQNYRRIVRAAFEAAGMVIEE